MLCRGGRARDLFLEWRRSCLDDFGYIEAVLHRAEELVQAAVLFAEQRLRGAVDEHLASLASHLAAHLVIDGLRGDKELVERLQNVVL